MASSDLPALTFLAWKLQPVSKLGEGKGSPVFSTAWVTPLPNEGGAEGVREPQHLGNTHLEFSLCNMQLRGRGRRE